MDLVVPRPTVVSMPFGKQVVIACFGREDGKESNSWRRDSPNIYERVALAAAEQGAEVVYAVKPDFSGRVVSPGDFRERFTDGVVPVWNSLSADGVRLSTPGQAFFIAPADCPTIVCHLPGSSRVVCAHAGRDCLYDRPHLDQGAEPRQFPSVVDSVAASVEPGEVPKLRIFVCCGIGPRNFCHFVDGSTRGQTAAKILGEFRRFSPEALEVGPPEEGRIDLRRAIFSQFRRHGVPDYNMAGDCVDTFADEEDGRLLWWSNRRNESQRNGVLVVLRKTASEE